MHAAAVVLALAQVVAPSVDAGSPRQGPRPRVVLDTTMGRIVVELRDDKAPATVDNFIKYVRGGHYDHTIFHRVERGFVVQGGGYDEDLSEHPTRPPIRNESANGLSNLRGTVAMARTTAPDSARSQFFINLRDNARLDGRAGKPGYTVFGEVVEGMHVIDRIGDLQNRPKGRFAKLTMPVVTIRKVREIEPSHAGPAPTPEVGAAPQPETQIAAP